MVKAKSAIAFTLFTAGVGNSFVFAVMPPIGREMGLIEDQIGLIITASAFMFMITAPLWGARSEVIGRRKVILFGLGSYGITTCLFAYVIQLRLDGTIAMMTSFLLLLLLRCIFTSTISGIFPASQAFIADITTPEERTSGMAIVGVSMGLGMIAGPGIAALAGSFDLVLPFYAVALLSVVAGVWAWRHIKEIPQPHHDEHHERHNASIRSFLPFFAVSVLAMANLSCMQQASGFYFQDLYSLTAAETVKRTGPALMASAFGSVAAQMLVVRRLGWTPLQLLRTGAPLTAIGIGLMLSTTYYPFLVLGMGVFGVGQGMLIPGNVASLSLRAGAHEQGRAAGLNTSAQGCGFVIGPMLGSVLYRVDPLMPYATSLALALLLMGVVYFAVRAPKTEPVGEA